MFYGLTFAIQAIAKFIRKTKNVAGPIELKDEETDGPLVIDHGDPAVIEITEIAEDLSSYSYFADVRQSTREDEVLVSWLVSVNYDPSTQFSTMVLTMSGDSALGALDGDTRKIPTRKCVMDVQEVDTNGVPRRTFARGELVGKQDVTR